MNRKPQVGVGISVHPDALEYLLQTAEVEIFPWDAPTETIRATIAAYDGMIVYSPDLYMQSLDLAGRLKVNACHSCSPQIARRLDQSGIQLTLTPTLWDTVADITLGLIFAAARNIPQADAAIRAGVWGKTDLKVKYSGLNVFEEEPLPQDHPLLSLENVILTPHLGGSSKECDWTLVENTLRILKDL